MNARANLRTAQKEQTRADILRAARARFAKDGYEGAHIRHVASDAGVSVGSVHAHFRDKHALLRACLHDDIARALEVLWRTLDEDAPLLEQLLHCARVLFASYAKRAELSRVMLAHTLFPAAGAPPDELFGGFLAQVSALFEAAERRGEVSLEEGEALDAARVFFSLYLSTLVGGLGGAFGTARSATRQAELWASGLEPLLRLFIKGVGVETKRRRKARG